MPHEHRPKGAGDLGWEPRVESDEGGDAWDRVGGEGAKSGRHNGIDAADIVDEDCEMEGPGAVGEGLRLGLGEGDGGIED